MQKTALTMRTGMIGYISADHACAFVFRPRLSVRIAPIFIL